MGWSLMDKSTLAFTLAVIKLSWLFLYVNLVNFGRTSFTVLEVKNQECSQAKCHEKQVVHLLKACDGFVGGSLSEALLSDIIWAEKLISKN